MARDVLVHRWWLGFKQSILDPIARVLRGVGSGMFARTLASPPCSCPLRLSPSGKTVDPEAPLPASPVCDRDSTRRFHGARFPASGSSGESFAPGDVAMDDPGFVDHPSNDAVHDSPVEEAPQMTMVCATPGLDLARLAIRCRFVDRFAGLRVPSRVSRQRFSAPGASLPSDGSR